MADLSDLFSSETPVWMTLENPNTFEPLTDPNGKPMRVSVWSVDSEAVRAAEKRIANDMLERASRVRGGRFKMDADSTERYARARFIARIAGWENLVLGGQEFACTEENKAKLYDRRELGPVRRQIEAFFGDEGNFLPTTESPLTA